MRARLKVAAVQMQVDDDADANLERVLTFIDKAANAKCDIVCFPETSLIHDERDASHIGRYLHSVRTRCRERSIWCIVGSYESVHARIQNCAYLIDSRGTVIQRYAKVHLYRSELGRGISPGRFSKVVRTELGVIGIIICFDFAFPDFVKRLSSDGVEIIFCPSFMVDYRGWKPTIRAVPLVRAFENTAYYVHCDAVTWSKETAAMSFISEPQRLLASIEKEQKMITAILDLKRIRKMKENLELLR